MRVYRFTKPRWATKGAAFSGQGGLHFAGRWNPVGTPLVYTSTSIALALLEVIVHIPARMPASMPLFIADVPDGEVERLTIRDVPDRWNVHPPAEASREVGRRFCEDPRRRAALLVPSAVVPEEFNCLLNPRHPRFTLAWVQGPFDHPNDRRLQRFTEP